VEPAAAAATGERDHEHEERVRARRYKARFGFSGLLLGGMSRETAQAAITNKTGAITIKTGANKGKEKR
jgi:hypothetical protein